MSANATATLTVLTLFHRLFLLNLHISISRPKLHFLLMLSSLGSLSIADVSHTHTFADFSSYTSHVLFRRFWVSFSRRSLSLSSFFSLSGLHFQTSWFSTSYFQAVFPSEIYFLQVMFPNLLRTTSRPLILISIHFLSGLPFFHSIFFPSFAYLHLLSQTFLTFL